MQPKDDVTYSEAIEQIMLNNGYVAPLKLLYKELWNYKDKTKVIGKTPFATVQAIVQRDKKFTKIGLGVYALTNYLNKLPREPIAKTTQQKKERLHANIQGMLIEIGNNRIEVENTYTNDKKWIFNNKQLGSLATLPEVPPFTFKNIINQTVRFFDVIWFNRRNFPIKIFEVEHSTDFRDAFIKFMELQDFRTIFCCISSEDKLDKFLRELNKSAFESLKDRCEFFSYDQVENDYNQALTKTYL